jgi:hypothetical protein
LNVNITNNILAVAPLWNIAIQVPVISQDTEIKLDVNAFPKHIALVQIAQEDLHGNGKEGFSRESIVIKTDSEWEAFKQKINTTNNVVDAYFTETEIDFSAYQIIAVFDEVKGNGGWSIDITGITEWQDKILISVTNLKKGGATSVMTQPFQIIKIPVSDKEIVFEYDLDENLNISLKGTKWKLTSFVFAADGSIKEPKPSGNSYFTVYFAPDSKTLTGFSSTNELFGEYEIDDQASTIKIKQLGGTKINEQYDGKLFVDNLLSIHSFSVEDKDLKLYYNELGDYLLFTVYRDLENEPSPDLTIADFNIPADCGVSYAKMQHDSIYMINSKEEWASIFTCETNPQVDFSTKTLFVAFGSTTNGISNISKKLLFENNAYSLTVDVTLDMTAVAQGWHIILITDKINMQSVILNLNKHFGNENL